jgi:hypothetical protein
MGITIKIEEAGMVAPCLTLRGQVKSHLVNSGPPNRTRCASESELRYQKSTESAEQAARIVSGLARHPRCMLTEIRRPPEGCSRSVCFVAISTCFGA